MPASGRVWQGVPGAGGRGAGPVAEGVRHRGDGGGLRRDAGASSVVPLTHSPL